MKVLHIIKKTNDTYAWESALRQREKKDDQVLVLLLHDAVLASGPVDADGVFACRDDVAARGVKTKAQLVGYEEIVKMLLEADSVVCW